MTGISRTRFASLVAESREICGTCGGSRRWYDRKADVVVDCPACVPAVAVEAPELAPELGTPAAVAKLDGKVRRSRRVPGLVVTFRVIGDAEVLVTFQRRNNAPVTLRVMPGKFEVYGRVGYSALDRAARFAAVTFADDLAAKLAA